MLGERTFVHEGVTYTLRQPTIFDEEMRTAAWIDLGNALAAAKGIEVKDLPHTIQRLSGKYVDWMQVTAITPQPAYAKSGVYAADIDAFAVWTESILANGQALAVAWDSAYRAVTDTADKQDEKKVNGADSNGHSSEPLLHAEPVTTD